MFGLPSEAVGAIAAAVIAGLIPLLGLIITKEQKVSDFRQAWIDALRSDVATVITHAHAIRGAYVANTAERWELVRDDFVGINEAWARIRLRFNPKERSSIAVLDVLKEHEALFAANNQPDLEELEALDRRLLENHAGGPKTGMDSCSFGRAYLSHLKMVGRCNRGFLSPSSFVTNPQTREAQVRNPQASSYFRRAFTMPVARRRVHQGEFYRQHDRYFGPG